MNDAPRPKSKILRWFAATFEDDHGVTFFVCAPNASSLRRNARHITGAELSAIEPITVVAGHPKVKKR